MRVDDAGDEGVALRAQRFERGLRRALDALRDALTQRLVLGGDGAVRFGEPAATSSA